MDLTTFSKSDLLKKCEELGIVKCKSKNKEGLIELINKIIEKNNTNIKQNEQVEQVELVENIEDIKKSTKIKKIKKIKNNINNTISEDTENKNNASINVIDLFCGCGGMSKGLSDAGLNIIAGIDVWDTAINSYKKNFHHQAICEDLTKLPPDKFNDIYNKENKIIDLIVGGPPCQGFSIAGKRETSDPRNSLFMEYVKYIKHL